MKIQNNNVSVDLARKALACVPFVLDVIRVCEPCQMDAEQPFDMQHASLPNESIWKINTHSYDDVANMIHHIPIYLVKGKGEEYPEDLLGAYYSGKGTSSPYIKIFVEEIKNASNNNKQEFQWLFTKVLLHETMHAIMDVYNQRGFNGQEAQLYYKICREESYANGGALWIISRYAKKVNSKEAIAFKEFVEDYMKKQGKGYCLGVEVAQFPVRYMHFWINEKASGLAYSAELEDWKKSSSAMCENCEDSVKVGCLLNKQLSNEQ